MTTRPGLRSDRGQTTALVCAMLFTLAMFVALVVNVGQMVNRRVALQLVADAGAWSGATVQAVQLNHYAFWSRLVQNAYKNASGISLGFRASECWSGVAAVGMFEYAQSGMARAIYNFRGQAFGEARRHSLFNLDDLFPGERNNFDVSTIAGIDDGTVGAPLDGNILPMPLRNGERLYTGDHAWSRETPGQWATELSVRFTGRLPWAVSSAGSGNENWQCATILPPTSFRIYMPGPAGYKLQKLGQPYIFVWRVKEQRPTRALFFDRFLGPNAVPAMTAVAVAKAVGGNVHEGLSRYRAKMVPVSRYSLSGGFFRDPAARPGRLLPGSLRQIVH
ncbi:MAG: Tad domain-containing protein [Acidobacteriota bacterium]